MERTFTAGGRTSGKILVVIEEMLRIVEQQGKEIEKLKEELNEIRNKQAEEWERRFYDRD